MVIKKIGTVVAMSVFVFVSAFYLTSRGTWPWAANFGLAYAADSCTKNKDTKNCDGSCDAKDATCGQTCVVKIKKNGESVSEFLCVCKCPEPKKKN